MNLIKEVEVKLINGSLRKEYVNQELDNDCVVDFTLYAFKKKEDVQMSVYDIQVFNKEGRYMTLNDMEYINLINEIINQITWVDDNRYE